MTVAIVMGSSSDLPTMQPAIDTLLRFEVEHEVRVVSAHRTPFDMVEFGRTAAERGVAVIIAGAGGAAHLPGMLASTTRLPVIGVPVPSGALQGMDALLSVVQMPREIPVATVAIGGAENAALLAIRILGLSDPRLAAALDQHRTDLEQTARAMDSEVRDRDR